MENLCDGQRWTPRLTALLVLSAVLVGVSPAVLRAQEGGDAPDEVEADPATPAAGSIPTDASESDVTAADVTLPDLEVVDERARQRDVHAIPLPMVKRASTPDAARLMRSVPGANIVNNGPLSGQVQYRGMFGPRVNTLVDGVLINSACPNRMDPPLHYAPMLQLQSLELLRGIAPVSSGLETIGGTVLATTRTSRFTSGDDFEFHGDVGVAGRSVDDGFTGGGILWAANAQHRIHVLGGSELGDDYEVNNVTVKPTEYERHHYGGGYGIRLGVHEFSFDYRHDDTDDTGTPALPMDIRFTDADTFRGEYKADFDVLRLGGRISGTAIDHEMDNFALRTPPTTLGRHRTADTKSSGVGYRLAAALPIDWSELAVGVDGHLAVQDHEITNPNNAAFLIHNFNDVDRDLFGFFAEWTAEPADDWELEVGLRFNHVEMDAGRVEALTPGAPGSGPQTLRDRFNAEDRARSDENIDWVVKVARQILPEVQLQLAGGRKTRSPTFFERYAWLPLQASGGLADGRNYVGDIRLSPEVGHEVELGVEWRGANFYFTPRGFYRYVDNYVQGVPATDPVVIAVSTASGDPNPLEFSNVEAQLYGADAAFGVEFIEHWHVDGTISYVRGERLDIGDDLYRISPLTGTLALSYRRETWSVTVEGVFAAPQWDVSATNGETESDGYAVLNLYAHRELFEGLDLALGVENVFDTEYQDHLAGVNRAAGSDVPIGRRLPAPGRNLFVMLAFHW